MSTSNNSDELVRKAVKETLIGLGFDMREPHQLQADMLYLRKIRRGSEDITKVVRHSVLTLVVSTALYLVWEAIKSLLAK